MLSLLLMNKIAQLLLMVLMGFVLVKTGLLKTDDSSVLSQMSLYLIAPLAIFNSYQKEFDPAVLIGLVEAVIIGCLIMAFLFFFDIFDRKIFRMNITERAAVLYPNTGNLIIPLVAAVLGNEWVIYASAFFSAQIFVLWTVGIRQFRPDAKLSAGKILLNPNIVAVFAGLLFFLGNIRLPGVISGALTSVGDMLGPVSMLVTGMLFAGMDFKTFFGKRNTYLALLFRMVVTPLLVLGIIWILHTLHIYRAGGEILLIAALPAAAPVASTVSMFAQLYTEDGAEAGGLCVLSTLICVLTMPVFVYLYEIMF